MGAELWVESTGERHRLRAGQRLVLGRGAEAAIPILDPDASREHFSVELSGETLWVTDLGSKNGTRVDGARIPPHEPCAVEDAWVEVGALRIRVRREGAPLPLREEYEQLAELGRGAYGQVFAARHRASGREVAVKLLLSDVESASARERFLREGQVRIASPFVVETYEARVEGTRAYLVLELVRGQTLERLLAAGPLSQEAALRVGAQTALGLAAIHAAGVVHRDLKPGNLIVSETGHTKILDFGLAKLCNPGGPSLTASAQGFGTLAYVAPEQAEDAKRVTSAADLYSLGATLYHALAGRPPFLPGPDLVAQLFEEEPPPLRSLRADCPRPVATLIHRLLEKEPEDRPASAEAVARRLADLSREQGASSAPRSGPGTPS